MLIPPQYQNGVRQLLKELGNVGIYQSLRHHCGFVGNAYHKINGKVEKHTHCPKCGEFLRWIPIEEWIKSLFDPIPNHVVQEQP